MADDAVARQLTDSAILLLATLTTGHDKGDKHWSAFDRRSLQTEPPCQHLKRIRHDLLRLLADLTVKIRVLMHIHATPEGFGVSGAINIDPQCADPVTGSPRGTDLFRRSRYSRTGGYYRRINLAPCALGVVTFCLLTRISAWLQMRLWRPFFCPHPDGLLRALNQASGVKGRWMLPLVMRQL